MDCHTVLLEWAAHGESIVIYCLINGFSSRNAQIRIAAHNIYLYRMIALRQLNSYVTCFTAISICIEEAMLY